jgi:hypothetical protein
MTKFMGKFIVMGKFFYKNPCFEYNSDGNMEIIHKHCVGPMEVLIYGITKNKDFYFDWTFPEFYPNDSEMERDYRIISKERLLEAINIEINTCEKEGNNELSEKYRLAVEMIQADRY